MNYPKMIIFDYGHTLLYEPDWNSDRGNAELLKYATKNPNNCTVKDIAKGAELIFGEHVTEVRKTGHDISGQIANRTLYDYLGIEFSLSPVEMETVFWDNASSGAIMPVTDKMLDYLNENGIRTAVISNLLWSSDALTQRLNRLLPNNKFEFVMTSSDFLSANQIAYCLILHFKKQDFLQKMYGIAEIILRMMLRVQHRLVFTPYGMIIPLIKIT